MNAMTQRVDDERLDEGETDDHRQTDRAGRARVAGDAFARRGDGAPWPMAPAAAAMPRTNAAEMTPQRTPRC
jgi:hypothetical protein